MPKLILVLTASFFIGSMARAEVSSCTSSVKCKYGTATCAASNTVYFHKKELNVSSCGTLSEGQKYITCGRKEVTGAAIKEASEFICCTSKGEAIAVNMNPEKVCENIGE